MKSNNVTTGKKELIEKANQNMVIAVAAAAFFVMFALVASRALLSQRSYQERVIDEKEKAVQQLQDNLTAVNQLATSYRAFIETPDNVIGGNPNGTGDKDGDNAKIVLDALPSKYDFPALITSVEKLMKIRNFPLNSIGGTDDEVGQSTANSKDPIEMPFQFESEVGGFDKARDLLIALEQSIRPVKIKKVDISSGNQDSISINVDAMSYYQAEKGVAIDKKEIK